jgi:hypothetical protein
MNDIVQKVKQASGPMALGWILTVWLPVPNIVRSAVTTVASAVVNGAHAVVDTVQAPPQRSEATAQR